MMRVDQEVLPIRHADLVENIRHVMPDCAVTNRQLVGDLFVREALSYQPDNLVFPLGHGLQPCRWWCIGVTLLLDGGSETQPHGAIPFSKGLGLGGGIQRLNHCQYDGGRLNREDDAVDAGRKCLTHAGLVFKPAQQHDLTGGGTLPNLREGADGVWCGLQIQDDHVWSGSAGESFRDPPLVGRHDHLDGRAAFEHFL